MLHSYHKDLSKSFYPGITEEKMMCQSQSLVSFKPLQMLDDMTH